MLRELESMCLGVFGTLAMILALCNLYGTFATNDYRPIFVQGLAFWLLGSLCLWGWRCSAESKNFNSASMSASRSVI